MNCIFFLQELSGSQNVVVRSERRRVDEKRVYQLKLDGAKKWGERKIFRMQYAVTVQNSRY